MLGKEIKKSLPSHLTFDYVWYNEWLILNNFFIGLKADPIRTIGIINIVSSIIFLFVAFYFGYYAFRSTIITSDIVFEGPSTLINSIPFLGFPLMIAGINLFLGTQILKYKQNTKAIRTFATTGAAIFLIFPVLVLGATGIFLELLSFVIIILAILFTWSYWSKNKIVSTFLLLIVLAGNLLAFNWGFEEDYCSSKGFEVDPTGSQIVNVPATDSEKYLLGESQETTSSIQVGKAWKAHVECHETFDLKSAIRKKYGF